ncbi:hypothetical protein GWI33_007706 [Rhynchophorus ferrugineus]|uniref:Uncharacterized protein n=1 Tax=Rhynchophorus ferrugineus TaxID=354439 RepID=A0A834MI48_RHYFE|nr:hypothetical protein GWI33_007706 [Rhynchophorus ferrugineus]
MLRDALGFCKPNVPPKTRMRVSECVCVNSKFGDYARTTVHWKARAFHGNVGQIYHSGLTVQFSYLRPPLPGVRRKTECGRSSPSPRLSLPFSLRASRSTASPPPTAASSLFLPPAPARSPLSQRQSFDFDIEQQRPDSAF